ncbi:uncharacterized protein AAGF69_007229 [Amazona ochrocephala]
MLQRKDGPLLQSWDLQQNTNVLGYFDANGDKLTLASADRQPLRTHTELWRTCMAKGDLQPELSKVQVKNQILPSTEVEAGQRSGQTCKKEVKIVLKRHLKCSIGD